MTKNEAIHRILLSSAECLQIYSGHALAVTCVGYKNGKFQIKESDPVIKLEFTGQDASKFEQVDVPTDHSQRVHFCLTEEFLRREFPGFLPTIQ